MSDGGLITYVVQSGAHAHHHPDPFNPDILHLSIVNACLSAGSPHGYAESIARRVVGDVEVWLKGRPEVTTDDIRRTTSRSLKTYHPDASYLYEHHRTTL